MSIRCLIFKVLCALRVSVRALLLYHIRFALSSTFSDFFKIFFVFDRSAFATAILLYHIEFALSRTFFIFFQDFFRSRFAPAAFPRQLFSLYRAAFCAFSAPSLCDSFAILSLSGGKVKPFFLDFLCLLILLIWRPRLLTIVTKVVRMFSTAITARIVECVDYYCPCI